MSIRNEWQRGLETARCDLHAVNLGIVDQPRSELVGMIVDLHAQLGGINAAALVDDRQLDGERRTGAARRRIRLTDTGCLAIDQNR